MSKNRLGDINSSKKPKVRRRLAAGGYWAPCQGTCKKKFPVSELTIDHIIPLSSGGTSTETNLQLLCRPCHDQKDCLSGRVRPHKAMRRSIRKYMTWLVRNPLSNSRSNFGRSVNYSYGAGTGILVIRAARLTLAVLTGILGTLYRRALAASCSAITSRTSAPSATTATSTSAGMVPSTIAEWSPKKGKPSLITSLPSSIALSRRTGSGLRNR